MFVATLRSNKLISSYNSSVMDIGPDQIAMKYETNLSLKIGKTFESGFKLNSTYTSREPNCVKSSRPA